MLTVFAHDWLGLALRVGDHPARALRTVIGGDEEDVAPAKGRAARIAMAQDAGGDVAFADGGA